MRPAVSSVPEYVSHPLGVHHAFPLVGIPEELKKLADGWDVYIGSSSQMLPGFRQPDDAWDTLMFVRRGGEETSMPSLYPNYGGEGGYMVVILDFPNGDKLTEFIKLYLVSTSSEYWHATIPRSGRRF